MAPLALAFVLLPTAEIYLLLWVGAALGAPATFALVLATALLGAAIARRQGAAAFRGVREAVSGGREIAPSLAEGALVVGGALLLCTPGFMSDAAGLLLLWPPGRRALARVLVRRAALGATLGLRVGLRGAPEVRGADGPQRSEDPPPPGVIDV